jgi:hypothetical protein
MLVYLPQNKAAQRNKKYISLRSGTFVWDMKVSQWLIFILLLLVRDVTSRTLVQCVHVIVSLRSAAITVTTGEFGVTTSQSRRAQQHDTMDTCAYLVADV